MGDKQSKLQNFNKIFELSKALTSETDVDNLLKTLSDAAKDICSSEFCSILLLDSSTNELYFKTAMGGEAGRIKTMRISVGSGIAGWVAQHGEPLIVNDTSKDARFLGNVDKESKFVTKSLLAVPITVENKITGVLEVGNKKNDADYTPDDEMFLKIIASQAGVALRNAQLVNSLQNFHVYMIDILVSAIDKMSKYGQGHCVGVARIATQIARNLGIDGSEYENIYYGSLLHDIGILSVNDENFNDHPVKGYSMVEHIDILKNIAPIIANHHEYFDGSGYPKKVSGRSIPLSARIVSFAESYEEYSHRGDGNGNPFSYPEKFDLSVLQAARQIALT